MIDIGVNLTNTRFDKDRDALITRAKLAGVNAMLVTGTNVSESYKAKQLSSNTPITFIPRQVYILTMRIMLVILIYKILEY